MAKLTSVVLGGTLWVWTVAALAQGDAVMQTVGHGKIDWTNKSITATGSGAPDLKAPNVAVARLGAERVAKMDALRNILETVKGVRLNGSKSTGTQMDAMPDLKARVEGIVKNFKVLDTKYFSDGGVDVIVQVPLDGVLTEALVTGSSAKVDPAAKDPSGTTGIIINAKGLGITPALAPRLLDDKGQEIYGATLVSSEAVKRHGVAGYSRTLDEALKDARVSDKPLVVRALKLPELGGTDAILSAEDAAKITKMPTLLSNGKVIIVTD
jgi:hypothetical protein